MNTTRKIRPQPKLAHLTDQERDQIYQWLKTETYEAVLERIAKPRSQDGFDTHVSRHVLEVFRQREALAEALSAHTDERLTIEDLLALFNGEPIPYDDATLHMVQKNAFKLSCR